MLYLGIDGGTTKTMFSLCDERGNVLDHMVLGGSNYHTIGVVELEKRLREGIDSLCEKHNISKDGIDYTYIGLPSFGEAKDSVEILNETIGRILKPDRFTCVNDSVIAWAGSLGAREGINIVSGTGAIGFGVDSKGNTARAGGWSGAFCDEGSCHWIGRQAISIFTKQADGRLGRTPLYYIIKEYFNLEEDIHFCYIINQVLVKERSEMAKIQLLVKKAYDKGDSYAIQIYDQAAQELVNIVQAIKGKLQIDNGESIFISYSGGLFKSGQCILGPFRDGIARMSPGMKLTRPLAEPHVGAMLLAVLEKHPNLDVNQFINNANQ